MALNLTGPLSIGGNNQAGVSINQKLGRLFNTTTSLGSIELRQLAGVLTGPISMSDFYGKDVSTTGIQFVGSKVAFAKSNKILTPLTDLTGGIASAPEEGDLILVYVGTSSNAIRSFNAWPGEYLNVRSSYVNSSQDANLQVLRKFISGTPESISEFWHSGGGADSIAVYISAWRGVDPTNPLDVIRTLSDGINTVIADPPAITPITPGSYIISGAIGAGSTTTMPDVAEYTSTDFANFQSTGGRGSGARSLVIGVGHSPWTGGSFSPSTFGSTGIEVTSGSSYVAVTIALRPAQ